MSDKVEKLNRTNIENMLGLTTIQEGLLFHHLMEPDGDAYFEQMFLQIKGQIDQSYFKEAWELTVENNEMLRTLFRWKEVMKPVQIILKENTVDIRYVDLSNRNEIDVKQLKEEVLSQDRKERFNLQDVPFRITICKISEENSWIIVSFHHILMDGWSMGIVLSEWMEAYKNLTEGQEVKFLTKPSYQDFVKWQQDQVRKKGKQEEYWKKLFKGWEPVRLMAKTEESVQKSGRFSKHEMQLSALQVKALREFASENQVTLASVVYSVWGFLLMRYSDQEDVVFGTTVSGRNIELQGIEKMTGLFINTLPLRMQAHARSTVLDFIQTVNKQTKTRNEYEHTPLSDLKVYAGVTAEQQLFESNVVIENYPIDQVLKNSDHPLSIYHFEMFEQTELDLTLSVQAFNENIHLSYIYNPAVFTSNQMKMISEHFTRLLSNVLRHPEYSVPQLQMLAETEKEYQLNQICKYDGLTGYEERTVIDMFEEQVKKTPKAKAIEFGSEQLTYEELNKKVNQFAYFLKRKGVLPEQRIGIMTEHSIEMVIACLAILKTGAAYVPIDPDYPRERIEYLLNDSGVKILLTQEMNNVTYSYNGMKFDIKNRELFQGNDENPAKNYGSQNIAYCIYTSGTTGRPKGVLVKHLGLENYIDWAAKKYVRGEKRDFALYTSLAFDLTITSIFTPLVTGNTIIIYHHNNRQLLVEHILKDNRAHVMKLTPSHLYFIKDLQFPNSAMKCFILGGEQLETSLAEKIEKNFDHQVEIFNEYGPTETVVGCTSYLYSSTKDHNVDVPIGLPATQTDIYILDRHMNLLPQGMIGELYIGGKGVARGYLGRDELTKERFVENPFKPGERLYKTGDAACFMPDGNIRFLGRKDEQIKLRGYRIEIGEIEHWLNTYEKIKSAAVAVKIDPSETPCLVAYFTSSQSVKQKELRDYLSRYLPEYMVPSHFIAVDTMPLTANGKLDKKALPAINKTVRKEDEAEPNSDTTKIIQEIWHNVLGVANIGVHDKFFEIGGNSLNLIQVNQQLSKKMGKDIPMVEMFRRPTIFTLADYLSGVEQEPSEKKDTTDKPIHVRKANEHIAIIGMAGRFPGAKNLDEFWENLRGGVESISFFTDEELLEAGIDKQTLDRPDYVKAKGIIEGPDLFDAPFFGYSPVQVEMMDPQIRLLHEYAWKALEDAGCVSTEYHGKIGLFTGSSSNFQWIQRFAKSLDGSMSELFEIGSLNDTYTVSTRIAHKLNLKGPAITLQTACSTSLVALHLACQSILNGESDVALAGGVSILHPVTSGYIYQENMVKSPDGHCRAFDQAANGTVGGDGVGFVVLKSLSQALADGDQIHAVVKGSAINNDGDQKIGYNAPSVQGQMQVIQEAITMANINPETINYVETHGTGTALGDPIEIDALTKAFQTNKRRFCRIGSVKTNIGHLDAAAGIAGLIKTVLSLKNKHYVPSLHFKQANPNIDFENSPFFVNDQLTPWEKNSTPRRAGISSFGMGGTNAHVILEEAPSCKRKENPRSYQLFPLSAKTRTGLEKMKKDLLHHIESNENLNIADASYTLQTGRKHFDYKQIFVAKDREEAVRLLTQSQERGIGSITHTQQNKEKKLVFMFSGQGSQYVNMGLNLYREEPLFKKTMDACFQEFYNITGERLEMILYPDKQYEETAFKKILETKYAQPAIFSIEYALAVLLMNWGMRPWTMIGYSFGELTAATLSGVFTLCDAMKLICLRGQSMQEAPKGAMLSVPLPEKEIQALLPEQISLAVVNDSSCIVSGLEKEIFAFEEQLKRKKLLCMRLNGSIAAHSHVMAHAAKVFGEQAKHMSYQKPKIPFFSNLTGDWMTDKDAVNCEYWMKHMTEPVRFAEGIQKLSNYEDIIFIEIGPGQDLSVLVKRSLKIEKNQQACNMLRHAKQSMSDVQFLLGKIGMLWMHGTKIDWISFHLNRNPGKISLPTYPFEKESFWYETNKSPVSPVISSEGVKKPLRDWFYMPQWKKEILPFSSRGQGNNECVLIFMEETAFAQQLITEVTKVQDHCIIVQKGSHFNKHENNLYTIRPDSADDYQQLFDSLIKDDNHISRVIHLWGLAERDTKVETPEWIKQMQSECFYSLLYLGQVLKKRVIDQEVHITVLSSLAYYIGGETVLYPEKALHLGPSMVISQESPLLHYRIIDIDKQQIGTWKEEKLLKLLQEELLRDKGSILTVYRDNKRYIRDYVQTALPSQSMQGNIGHLKQNGVYILIGGLGFIGLNLAQTLAEKTQGKLILTSRSGLPPRKEWQLLIESHSQDDPMVKKIMKVKAIEEAGAQVIIAALDVGKEEDINEVVQLAERTFGMVNGVIYAAGVTGEQSFRMMEQTDKVFSEAHLQAKMNGVLLLEKVLRDRPLDFCILLSSLSPILGGLGFTAYTAVNQFIDTFVYQHNLNHPVPWTALNFDGWEFEDGKNPDIPIAKNLQETLIRANEGRNVFEIILRLGHFDQIIVSATNLQERIDKYVDRLQLSGEKDTKEKLPLYDRPEISTEYMEPVTVLEKELSIYWQNFFKISQIGIDDDFFEMGGDSLKAINFISIIHKAFSVVIPLPEFFKIPTIREMAQYLSGAEKKTYQIIEKAPQKDFYPLSSAQKRLYLVQQFDKTSTGYNEFTAGRIVGKLNMEKLERTFMKLIKRHESLRTSFVVIDGVPVQKIEDNVEFHVEFFDLSDINDQLKSEQSQKEVINQFLKPFELEQAPLMRTGVMKVTENEYVLMLDMHHIISDGLSQDILISEFMDLYDGKELTSLELQYKDFSEWQNQILASNELNKLGEYWIKRLEGAPVLQLPTDYKRPEVKSFTGAHYQFRISKEELTAFKRIIAREDATLFMGILTIYQILLHKLTGQSDIVVGVPVAGRKQEELQKIIGIFVNMLPLRFYPKKEMTFIDLLRHVRQLVIEDFEHQDYQYENMVRDLKLKRDMSRNLIFDVVFALQNLNQPELEIEGIKLHDYKYETAVSRFDLLWIVTEEDGLSAVIEYNTDLFTKETIERLVNSLKEILAAVINDTHIKLEDIESLSSLQKLDEVSLLELDDLKI